MLQHTFTNGGSRGTSGMIPVLFLDLTFATRVRRKSADA
jgi:hypothetical protein